MEGCGSSEFSILPNGILLAARVMMSQEVIALQMRSLPHEMRTFVGAGAFCLFVLTIPSGALGAGPTDKTPTHKTISVGTRTVKLTLARPTAGAAPPFLVVFASGDGGLRGVSKDLLVHLAGETYWVVGFSSPEAFKGIADDSKGQPNYEGARDRLASLVGQAKQAMELPAQTPIVITGMSRGANVVVAAAGDAALRPGIVGAVAIALTREFDDLTVPDTVAGRPGVQTDDKGRLQTYPSLQRLGSMPLAIIQSTNDSYVRSSESRRLLGPDTPTRRLYEIESKNHSFGGGQVPLMRALDDAMTWVGLSLTAP